MERQITVWAGKKRRLAKGEKNGEIIILYYLGWLWMFLYVALGWVAVSMVGFRFQAVYFILCVLQMLALGAYQIYWKGLRTRDYVLTGLILAGLYAEMKWVLDIVKMAFGS
ncbi:hypothetical protein [Paenibacillus sp. OAS669]|uniref:hypothetical protein n=1 Tax=Paenibacillus sp. OAS669 TaxID=2663821 RepID=UPI001789D350|nr:hypothetical protein [Paenibacillus sp. OAS669]MBE1446806.1 hypothetical protein [Paenibacillus sp. OAS669]